MNNIFDIIKKRYSVRTYELKPIAKKDTEAITEFLSSITQGPFKNKVQLKLVQTNEDSESELKKYISYGNVKGARSFIAGSVKKGRYAMEDFGYCMEKAVLKATELGLGTVWLGGSLNRGTFAKALALSDDEVIPAITPLGYAADKRSMMDKVIRTLSGGKNRKTFEELFYLGDLSRPLTPSSLGKYETPLEAVRLAPSASNKQPWRIIKEKDQNVFHFYMNEHPTNRVFKDVQMQNNDMGIAMCHFELMANELGLHGTWQTDEPKLDAGNLIYIVSWKSLDN